MDRVRNALGDSVDGSAASRRELAEALEEMKDLIAAGAPFETEVIAACFAAQAKNNKNDDDDGRRLWLASSACLANAALASSKRGESVRLDVKVVVETMRRRLPLGVYLACAKMLHCTSSTCTDQSIGEVVASALVWSLAESHDALSVELFDVSYALALRSPLPSDVITCAEFAMTSRLVSTRVAAHAASLLMVRCRPSAPALARLLTRSLERHVVQGSRTASLVPVLAHAVGRAPELKPYVFPPHRDHLFTARLEQQTKDDTVHPADAPPFQLRTNLFALMTDLDPTLKRLATELLFGCCDNNNAHFAARCGLGNAIAFLQLNRLAQLQGGGGLS